MGVKYRMDFTDIYDYQEYRLDIADVDYTDDIIELDQLSDNPVEITYDGKEDAFQNPIVPSYLTANLIATEQFQFRDLITTDKFKFRCFFRQKLNGTFKNIWEGFLLPDIYVELFTDPPYEIELKFIDGFGLLKDIEYTPIKSGKLNDKVDRENCLEILQRALLPIRRLSSSDIFEFLDHHETRTSVDLLASNQRSDSVLRQHYLDQKAFIKETREETDSNGNVTQVDVYEDCFKVVRDVAKIFQAKVFKGPLEITEKPEVAGRPFFRVMGINLHNSGNGLVQGFMPDTSLTGSTYEPVIQEKLRPSANQLNHLTEPILVEREAELEFYLAAKDAKVTYEGQPFSKDVVPGKENNKRLGELGQFQKGASGNSWNFLEPKSFQSQTRYFVPGWNAKSSSPLWGLMFGNKRLAIGRGSIETGQIPIQSDEVRIAMSVNTAIDGTRLPSGVTKNDIGSTPPLTAKLAIIFTGASGDVYDFQKLLTQTEPVFVKRGSNPQSFYNYQTLPGYYKAEHELELPETEGEIKIELFEPNNFTYHGSSQNYSIDPVLEYSLKIVPAEADEIKTIERRNNAEVANDAKANQLEMKVPFTDSQQFSDRKAITLNRSIPLKPSTTWQAERLTISNSAYQVGHLKLLAREYLQSWEEFRRRIKGSATFANRLLFNKQLVIEEQGAEYGLMFYFHRWQVRLNKVDFEAIEGIFSTEAADFTDTKDDIFDDGTKVPEIPPVDGGIDNPVTPVADPSSNTLNFTGGPLPSEEATYIANLCDLDLTDKVFLPKASDMTGGSITIKAICPTCSSKSLTIQLQSPDTFPDGTTDTEISCGESVTLLFRAGINQWVIL